MKRMNKKGFTIVELVIVVAIVAILAAVLIPTFASIVKKANVSKDTQLIRNLNTALKADVKGQKNMTEALEAAAAFGYDVSKINASATDNEILWDSVNGVFCYYNDASKGDKYEYTPEFPGKETATPYQYWKIYNKTGDGMDEIESNAWSAYLGHNFEVPAGGVIDVKDIGIDVGAKAEDIKTINYSGTAGHTVIIRTDSAETTLNIDSATDTIYHYDLVGDVNVVKTADASYHEFGKAGYVQVASGRVVAENGGYINTVVLTEKGAGATKDAIIEEKGTGKFENKFATTNAVAGLNNADGKSVKLTLRNNDTGDQGDILLTKTQEDTLTGDDLKNAVTAATTETKRAAIASVTPDPYANAPADAYYAYVDEASGDIYYSLEELEVAYAGNQYRIVLLQDATNAFEFINDSTFTFDLNGHHLDLHGGEGFGVVASHVTIVDSKTNGKISTPEFGVMYNASLTIASGTIVFDDPDYPYCFGGAMAIVGLGGPTTITGGTFNVDPTGKLASGYSAAEVDGVWTVYKN